MDIYKQEVFGPVLCVMHEDLCPNLDAAVNLINNNQYGNNRYLNSVFERIRAAEICVCCR